MLLKSVTLTPKLSMEVSKMRGKRVKNQKQDASQHVIIEQLELFTPEGHSALPDTITIERNLLRFPFFSLSTPIQKDQIYLEDEIDTLEGKVKITWRVSRNINYDLPGKLARKLHRAIEKFINSLPRPISNPIRIGSFRDICEMISIKPSGQNITIVKATLSSLVLTGIEASGCFYLKDEDRYLKVGEGDDIFHLYSRVIYRGQKLPNGYTADAVYICLDDLYLRNLNAGYTAPIDWNFWERLKGEIPQRMYEILSLDVFLAFERKGRELQRQNPQASVKEILNILPQYLGQISFEKRYRSYCQYFPIVPQTIRWRACQQLASAHSQFAKERYLYDNPNMDPDTWQEIPGEPQNWSIRYYLGQRALDEYQRAKRRFLPVEEEPKPKHLPRSSRMLPTPRQQNPDRKSLLSSSPGTGEMLAAERPDSPDRYQVFIRFLNEEGVKRAEQLVKASPHSIDVLEVIQEDYLCKKQEALQGRFHFERGGHAWLAWAIQSKDYQRPKGIETQREKQDREEKKKAKEEKVKALAKRLKDGELCYFLHEPGNWRRIESFSLDSSDIYTWRIRYRTEEGYSFSALLSDVSEDRFCGDKVEIFAEDKEEEAPF
jgi:hypothetical protein